MERIEDKLVAHFHRLTCPDSLELGEYEMGLLPSDRLSFISSHLAECPHCRSEITGLQLYLRQLAPELRFSPAQRIRVWIARLIPPVPEGGLIPAPAFALRGEGGGPQVYEAGDAHLTIEVRDDPEKKGRKRLLGLVLGVDTENLVAHLWRKGRHLTMIALDELGDFIFGDLESGRYELILTGPSLEIHVQELVI
jgi:hypothetical protein